MSKFDLDSLKSATAVLTACFVRTLRQTDETFQPRFIENLDKAYQKLIDDDADIVELETLAWAREILTAPPL